jgi:hypothetical protein
MDKDSILRAAELMAEGLDYESVSHINPEPLPTAIKLYPYTDSIGRKFLAMDITTPAGKNTYFLDPESADKLADGIKETILK